MNPTPYQALQQELDQLLRQTHALLPSEFITEKNAEDRFVEIALEMFKRAHEVNMMKFGLTGVTLGLSYQPWLKAHKMFILVQELSPDATADDVLLARLSLNL